MEIFANLLFQTETGFGNMLNWTPEFSWSIYKPNKRPFYNMTYIFELPVNNSSTAEQKVGVQQSMWWKKLKKNGKNIDDQ